MGRIFISHSREDDEGRRFFDKILASVEHQGYWYSWEGPTPPHAQTLIEAIKASESMFVLLSKPMENPQTRSWVGYEVGVAAALKKKVWVFEPEEIKIDVPVPFVTGYIQYPKTLKQKNIFPYHTIIRDAGANIPEDPSPNETPLFLSTFCAYEDCRSPFFRYVSQDSFRCPSCRRELLAAEMIEH